ncbi:hypothetical protein [Oceaniradius stylonematis]|uniref:hypothetical protein n=1 Tax=Oceaniradius stylonematis TaxID=2184161 RepID=UPI00273E3B1B|nr:hypothetical protein [Oceaniradius stylonematis]
MPLEPRLGFGVILRMGDGETPEVFSEIAGIRDFDVEENAELVETTNHGSATSNGVPFREYIAGPIDGTEITLPLIYDYNEATHNTSTGLRSKKGQRINFELVEPGSTKKESFTAIVLNFSRSYPVGEVMAMDVTLKPVTPFVEADDT